MTPLILLRLTMWTVGGLAALAAFGLFFIPSWRLPPEEFERRLRWHRSYMAALQHALLAVVIIGGSSTIWLLFWRPR